MGRATANVRQCNLFLIDFLFWLCVFLITRHCRLVIFVTWPCPAVTGHVTSLHTDCDARASSQSMQHCQWLSLTLGLHCATNNAGYYHRRLTAVVTAMNHVMSAGTGKVCKTRPGHARLWPETSAKPNLATPGFGRKPLQTPTSPRPALAGHASTTRHLHALRWPKTRHPHALLLPIFA